MSIEGVIREEASGIAGRQHHRALSLEKEYLAIQGRAEELRVQCDSARAAPDRLLNFQVKIGAEYQCPACWIERDTRAPMVAKPSASKEDIFECVNCGHMIIITY
jgi:DNA-directed RNA polymerase subunit RPC12/RpoP